MKRLRICLVLALSAWIVLNAASAQTLRSPRAGEGYSIYQQNAAAGASSAGAYLNALSMDVIRQVNMERSKAGLGELRVDAELNRAACVRVLEITRRFSHTRPDGGAWNTVSDSVLGENIAMGQRTADKVMAAWLTSAGHRANILRPGFGSIGVCAYRVNGVTYWAQLFGR